MPSIQVHANATLNAQKATLLKLADEYCELGNQHVISAHLWVQPLIIDFIDIVSERHQTIADYAAKRQVIESDIVRAADNFLDKVIDLVVSAYPLTASYQVRSITSKIRNDLAIARLDAEVSIDKKSGQPAETEPTQNIDILQKTKISAKKFQEYAKKEPRIRDALSSKVFNTSLYHAIARQAARDRRYIDIVSFTRLSDLSERKYLTQGQDAVTSPKEVKETPFDAFRRYWKSLPYGNVYLALAIKNLLLDDKLLKRVIRFRVDVKELLLACLPTVEMRKQALQHIMKNNYLSLKMVASIFEVLPEGENINWRVDMAEFGILKYESIAEEKNAESWEHSRKKIRADAYLKLLDHFRYSTALEKKIIIYALLNSEGKKMQPLVCKAMGYAGVEATKKILYASIEEDALQLKIDLSELEQTVIQAIIDNINAGHTVESGAYTEVIEKLLQLVPHAYAVKSVF